MEKIDVNNIIKTFKSEIGNCKDLDDFLDFSYNFSFNGIDIKPSQIKTEIRKLLRVLKKTRPKTIVEIGTSSGGTLFLLCKIASSNATIVSIDLPNGGFGGELFPAWKTDFYKSFASQSQSIYFIRRDSHHPQTVEELKRILKGHPIDFLLIDGDHSYEGVSKDFHDYKRLVAPDGLIAFHDIHQGTEEHAGKVPQFWNELKKNHSTIEIIDDEKADGYGIGLVINNTTGSTHSYENIFQMLVDSIMDETARAEDNPLGLLLSIYDKRPDLQRTFPSAKKGDYVSLINWAAEVCSDNTKIDSEKPILSKFSSWYQNYRTMHASLVENENIKSKISSLDKEISKKNSIVQELQELKDVHSEKIAELETLREQNERKVAELETLREQNERKVAELETLREQNERKVAELETLREQNERKVAELETLREQNERKVAELEDTNKQEIELIYSLEKDNLDLENENDSLNKQLELIQNSIVYTIGKKITINLDRMFPPNSKRGRVLWKISSLIRKNYPIKIQSIDTKLGKIENETYRIPDYVLDSERRERYLQAQSNFSYKPIISIIVPVFNTDPAILRKTIQSVKDQFYENWQLCICDDGSKNIETKSVLKEESRVDNRIKVVFSEVNSGIAVASNKALSLATGEFVLLLDHDDILLKNALTEIVRSLNKDKDVDFIYSDEDKIDANENHMEPFFKPDWSPDLLFSYNYPIHVSVFRTSILRKIGGFREGFDGSQDYDLILRYTEQTKKILHIAKVLYSWRKIRGSTALNMHEKNYAYTAGKKALEDAIKRRKIDAIIEDGLEYGRYRIRYKIIDSPLVSIIIPTRNIHNLKQIVTSILKKSTYKNFEIVVLDNSKTPDINRYCNDFKQINCLDISDWSFNFSKFNNHGVSNSKGEYIIFLNDDTEVITRDWIECLLEHAQRNEIGLVGAKLLYQDGKVQHAGTIIGIDGHAGNYGSMTKNDGGYFSFPNIIRNCSAVTAACMMMRKKLFMELRGYDEKMAQSWQDVDLCIRIIQNGKYIIYTPYSVLYHYEGGSRGKVDVTKGEEEAKQLFKSKHKQFIENGDPFYNPNLSLLRPFDYVLKFYDPLQLLKHLYNYRKDLQTAFPNDPQNGFHSLIDWAATHGVIADNHKDEIMCHYDYYYSHCSPYALPLAKKIRLYLHSSDLKEKFPEVLRGDYQNYLKYCDEHQELLQI